MLDGKKILVVEDSRTIKLQLKMILEKEGVSLIEVGSEWGLFNKVDEYGEIVDLVIMDLVINSEDGLDLIKKLKSTPRYKKIPIIIITQKVDIPSILEARSLGVQSYLKKPIRRAELIKRIEDALDETDTATP